jgi:hypothetical protein
MRQLIFILTIGIMTTGCGALNNRLAEKTKMVEYYRIFDIKTTAGWPEVIDAASNGLGRNVGNASEATPIPPFSTPPDEPGRFKIVNPLEGTNLGMLAGLQGGSLGFKMATCDGAIWTANAERDISGSNNLRITACLFQYKEGYHLDTYGIFTKEEGGLKLLGRAVAHKLVGTPEQWTEKAFLDIVRNIRKMTSAEVILLEGHPKMDGTPWLDTGESVQQTP